MILSPRLCHESTFIRTISGLCETAVSTEAEQYEPVLLSFWLLFALGERRVESFKNVGTACSCSIINRSVMHIHSFCSRLKTAPESGMFRFFEKKDSRYLRELLLSFLILPGFKSY